MQKVNALYAERVSNAFDDAIRALKNCPPFPSDDDQLFRPITPVSGSEGEDADHPDNSLPPKHNVLLLTSKVLTDELESLRNQTHEILSLTLEQDESLRSDIRKYECEWSTRSEEYAKQQSRLRTLREERKERRIELEKELLELEKVFEVKKSELNEEQQKEGRKEEEEIASLRKGFERECEAFERERDDLRRRLEEQRQRYDGEESEVRAENSSTLSEINRLSQDHEAEMKSKKERIATIRIQLEEQKKRRKELEEHFERVDRNNAVKMLEDDALRIVADLKKRAMKMLDNGAVQLQKYWRGIRDRGIVAKMKSGKSKKKGGKKKGAKKKK